MIPLLAWGAGAVAAYFVYEKAVKKEAHPFTGAATLPGRVRAKAVALIHTSQNPTQLRALATALQAKGDPQAAAAAQQKATAVEQQQAPFARTISDFGLPTIGPVAAPTVTTRPIQVAPGVVLPPISFPMPPQIKQGSGGPAVMQWQVIVGVTPDGKFGPQTKAATVAWQKQRGLKADGIVGKNTWTAALSGA